MQIERLWTISSAAPAADGGEGRRGSGSVL
jgi:hypothetical protein